MCIIAIKPKGLPMFNDDQLKTMFTNNPDGAGYMYYDKATKSVVVHKGYMTLKALKKSLLKRGDLTNVNVVLHFRISTSGNVDGYNCHPFPVYDTNKMHCHTNLAVAHNGILHDYEPAKKSPVNDTQVFIKYVLANLSPKFVYNEDAKFLIRELIGSNKLAFLTNKGDVVTLGAFVADDDGYIYSNNSYLPDTRKKFLAKRSNKVSTSKKFAPATSAKSAPLLSTTPIVSTTPTETRTSVYDYDDFDPEFTPNEFWAWFDKKHPA